jgi:hypothetical protein
VVQEGVEERGAGTASRKVQGVVHARAGVRLRRRPQTPAREMIFFFQNALEA